MKIISSDFAVTKLQEENIKNAIISAKKDNPSWNIDINHRFFIADKFYETNYIKDTKYPLQGTKSFDLLDILKVKELPEI